MPWLLIVLLFFASPAMARTPEEIVSKLNENFVKIKDAQADITLDTSLQILGCGGINRQKGRGWFKAPDKIKAVLNKDAYLIWGNYIRQVDPNGKLYYITLLHAPDFSVGFHPGLITHNFYLKTIKENEREVILEGLPKPGVLKNVKKLVFHIDPKEYLLTQIDVILKIKSLSGKININYEKIKNAWVPVAVFGHSAVELSNEELVGFNFNLKGENFKINSGIPDYEFRIITSPAGPQDALPPAGGS